MKWVGKDGQSWVLRQTGGRWYPKTLQLGQVHVQLQRFDPRRILEDLTVKLQRCDGIYEDEKIDDADVARLVEKSNKDFLDDLDEEEDEGVLSDISSEAEDEWRPEGFEAAVKPRILKTGGMVFGKRPKGPPSAIRRSKPNFLERRGEMSEYERIRQQNIAERKRLFEEILEAAKDLKPSPVVKKRNSAPRRRTIIVPYSTRTEPISLRSRHVSGSDSGVSSGLSTPVKRRARYFDDDGEEDYRQPARKRRSFPARWAKNPNVDVATPEDVSEEMLENVADFVSEKVYNQAHGTSCHQCRQKTLDTKTICRSGHCHGVRGAFCGVCLKNRYGQDVREALKDPNWTCPPCQDKCNCSICRNRKGKAATGILTGLALNKGFNSVAHYLDHLVINKGNDEYDEE